MSDPMRERALMEAMEKHRHRVFRLAVSCLRRRADAEDVLQEVFLKYYRFAPEFADDEHEKAWILRVTVNACRSLLRAPWKRFWLPVPENVSAEETPGGLWLIALVHRLPPQHAMAIHLHYYEDYSVKEIAEILRVPEGTVKSRLARARSRLKEMIEEEEKMNG